MMTLGMTIGQLILSGGAIFLIGINLAIVTLFFKWRIKFPIVGKMLSVAMLLVYIAFSARYGNPSTFRVGLGVVALLIDGCALAWIIATLRAGRSLVPEWLKEDT